MISESYSFSEIFKLLVLTLINNLKSIKQLKSNFDYMKGIHAKQMRHFL